MSSAAAPSSVLAGAPAASSSAGQPIAPDGPPPLLSSQASLYLYTFLVTLILLLSVSGAIVVRSYLMRRRHRRMVEEAIRNGTYVPPANSNNQLGQKPAIYDAYLGVDGALEVVAEGKAKGRSVGPMQGDAQWESILPISALLLNPDGSAYNDSGGSKALAKPPIAALPRQTTSHWRSIFPSRPFPGFMGILRDTEPAAPVDPATTLSSPDSLEQKLDEPAPVQSPHYARVSVIVAMPWRPQSKARYLKTQPLQPSPTLLSVPPLVDRLPVLLPEENPPEELPHLEIGIMDAPLKRWQEEDAQVLTTSRTPY